MHLRGTALAVAAVCTTLAALAAPASAESTRAPGGIDIPCAGHTLHQQASWYLPPGAPRGLIWLQHGFARTSDNVADLAAGFAAAGYLVFTPSLPFLDLSGCTLQNLGDNTGFLDNVAQLFATASDPDGALARNLRSAATPLGRAELTIPPNLVFIGHSAGAEAVEYVAHRLHTDHPAAWAALRGLILLDPVKSFLGDNTDTALTDLDRTELPILTVSAPPSLCNNLGSGTTAMQTLLHRPYLGIRISSGVHTDAEGDSTDIIGEIACGTPESVNIATLHKLTLGWAGDYLDGTRTADYYPPAAPITDIVIAAAPSAQILRGLPD
ncbi:hypothetical protein [Nocardia jejuensis]|uniref:hypothetical protein n=1 Tax=Nocardia jejuensis TaxID=328049 RepID=UPI0008361678|nr:hypothetical protein [Nocardia jejuensis]